jgi:hypothetical protein
MTIIAHPDATITAAIPPQSHYLLLEFETSKYSTHKGI